MASPTTQKRFSPRRPQPEALASDSPLDLLPDEVLDKVLDFVVRWSTVKALRLTCKRFSSIEPSYHLRQCRIRDQYQDTQAIDTTANEVQEASRCFCCGYSNRLRVMSISSGVYRTCVACSFPACRNILCVTPMVPQIIHLSNPGTAFTQPERFHLKVNTSDLIYPNTMVQYAWQSKYPDKNGHARELSEWKGFSKLMDNAKTTSIYRMNIFKLYRFRVRFRARCKDPGVHVGLKDCEKGECLFSQWSKPTLFAHPLTSNEAKQLRGLSPGYFAK